MSYAPTYALTVITPPSLEPLGNGEAKDHSLVIHNSDDNLFKIVDYGLLACTWSVLLS